MYTDPVIKKYIDLIKAANPEIKAYYQGEPRKVAASMLPAVFISKVATEAGAFTNSQDQHQAQFRLTLVTDIREELRDEQELVPGIARLYELMEARNDDYTLKAASILNILRANIAVDTANNLRTDLSTTTRIDYGEAINRRDAGWFIEAHIDFIGQFTQTR